MFLTVFYCFSPFLWPRANSSRPLAFLKSNHEQIAPVAHYNRATMRDLLPSLFTKEWFAIFVERMALLLFCSQKTSDSLKKPKTEFPTLLKTNETKAYSTLKRNLLFENL